MAASREGEYEVLAGGSLSGFGVYYMFHAIRRYFSKAIMLAGTATFRVCGRIPRRSSTNLEAGDIVSLAQPVFRSATSESHGVHFACH